MKFSSKYNYLFFKNIFASPYIASIGSVIALPIALLAAPAHLYAQSSELAQLLPQRPVLVVVPNAAGGPNDIAARLLAPKLAEVVKQNFIVDNRASANGVTGSDYVAKATPNGTFLSVGNTGTHAINGSLYKKPLYDPVRDFAAVARIAPDYYLHDAVVPRTRLAPILARIAEIGAQYGVHVCNVFHAGDGNLHPNVPYHADDPDENARVHSAMKAIMELCIAEGGTISGEHGVGFDKLPYMAQLFPGDSLDAMLRRFGVSGIAVLRYGQSKKGRLGALSFCWRRRRPTWPLRKQRPGAARATAASRGAG